MARGTANSLPSSLSAAAELHGARGSPQASADVCLKEGCFCHLPRLGSHWTCFQDKETSYLQTCLAESGNGPVKALWDGFPQTCVLQGSARSSSHVSRPCCYPHLLRSPTLAATRAFGVHKPWQSFRQTDTPPPHLAPGAPPPIWGAHPSPGAALESRCTCPRQDGMGQGRGARGIAL